MSPKQTDGKQPPKRSPRTSRTGGNGGGGAGGRGGAPRPRRRRPAQLEGSELALAIARVGLDRKALNVEIIDVHGKVDYADYVVVMSGRSDRQVAALAGYIEQELYEKHHTRCSSVEGLPQSSWVLMDFGDVIVHIFHQDTRGYYDVEALWMDAARLPLDADAT